MAEKKFSVRIYTRKRSETYVFSDTMDKSALPIARKHSRRIFSSDEEFESHRPLEVMDKHETMTDGASTHYVSSRKKTSGSGYTTESNEMLIECGQRDHDDSPWDTEVEQDNTEWEGDSDTLTLNFKRGRHTVLKHKTDVAVWKETRSQSRSARNGRKQIPMSDLEAVQLTL